MPRDKIELMEIAGGSVVLCTSDNSAVTSGQIAAAMQDKGYHWGRIPRPFGEHIAPGEQFPVARSGLIIIPADLRYGFYNRPDRKSILAAESIEALSVQCRPKTVKKDEVLASFSSETTIACRYPDGRTYPERVLGLENLAYLAGKNATFSAENRCITADSNGYYHIGIDGSVSVWPVRWVVEIPADYKETEFEEAIHIAGDVVRVDKLRLQSSLDVAGKIEDSTLNIEGSLSCREDIFTKSSQKPGRIYAGDDVSCREIRNCQLTSAGSVYAAKGIRGGSIEARDTVYGGDLENVLIRAGKRVVAGNILSGTEIRIGSQFVENAQFREQAAAYEVTRIRLKEARQMLLQPYKRLVELRKKATAHVFQRSQKTTAGPDHVLRRFCASINENITFYKKYIVNWEKALQEYEERIPSMSLFLDRWNTTSPRIYVLGTIAAGSTVTFPDKKVKINKSRHRTIISYDKELREVIFRPMEEFMDAEIEHEYLSL